MSISNSTTLNDLVGQVVSEQAISAAIDTRVMRPLINSTQMPLGAGSMVVPRFQDVAVASLTEGVAPNSTAWSTDGTTLTPVERGVFVQISKRVLFADPFTDLAPYGDQLGRQLGEDEDAQILALVSGNMGTQIIAGAMNKDALLSGIASLEASGAPGPYFGVFHPSAWAELRSDIGDASVFATPGKDVVEGLGDSTTTAANGYVGSPYGIPCYITNQVVAHGNGDHANLLASKQAVSHAFIQDLTVDVDDNVTARAFDLMAWYSAHQAVTAADWGVEIVA